MSETSASTATSIGTGTSAIRTMPSPSSSKSEDHHRSRPTPVSRSTSEPAQQKKPDPPSSSSPSSSHSPLRSKSTDITSTIFNEDDNDDDVVAQATAIALQAQQQLAKQAQQLHNKKNQNPFLAAIESHANNAGVSFNFAGHTDQDRANSLPVGDLQQKKLIAQKLGSQALSNNNHNISLVSTNTNSHGNSHSSVNNATASIGGGMKDVKEKLEQFFQPQSASNVNKEQDVTTTTTTTASSSSNNNSHNNNTITVHGVNNGTSSPTSSSEKPLLSAIVWKRRSGYGKFSMNAWEKREIQLVGSKLMYFKCKEKEDSSSQTTQNNTNNSNKVLISSQHQKQQALSFEDTQNNYVSATPSPSLDTNLLDLNNTPKGSTNDVMSISASNPVDTIPNNNSNNNNSTSNTTTTIPKPQKKDLHQFWEQTKQNFTKSITELSINNINNNPNHSDDDTDSPRGIIDLQKENVSVAAISDHEKSLTSVSPTPYGLCISLNKIRKSGVGVGVGGGGGSERSKWKICFDSHGEQIRWLTILTEIIVRKSVNMYNQKLMNSKNHLLPSLNDGIVVGGGDDGGNKITGSAGTVSNAGGVNNLLEAFRPAPKRKDGMWNFDEQFSGKSLLDQRIGVAVTAKARNGENDDDDDISYDDEDQEKGESDIVSTSPCISESMSMKEGVKNVIVESPIIYDLPEAINALIVKGAQSSHGWFIKGHNLSFVFGVVNLSLVWLHISPVYWLLFPFYLILINAVMLVVVMERNGNPNNKTKPLNSIQSCVQILRRRSMNEQDEGQRKTTKAKNTPKKSETKSASMKKQEHDNVITNAAKKPIAGTTTKRLSDPSDLHFVNNNKFISWTVHPPQDVQVRSHGYLRTKVKVPSPASLYEVTNVELFESDYRVSEMASKVVLPQTNSDDNNDANVRWKSPETFVVSLAIPTEEPSLTRPTEDGFGVTVTIYYKMKNETREILKRISEPGYNPSKDTTEKDIDVQKRVTNGVRLWEEWCRRAPTDADWQARFKLLPNVLNPAEVGLPSWIAKYCGKPVLIKRRGKTGFLSTHPELNAFEFDISLHVFPYLAKKAMAYLRSTIFKKALVSLTYVVESRSDDELPEVVIGEPVKLCYPDPDILIHANNWFR